MTQEINKPKTLTMKKPLSLHKQAEISTTFGANQVKKSTSEADKIFKTTDKVQHVPVQFFLQEKKIDQRKAEQQRQKCIQNALTWLKVTYPACFKVDPSQPLKIGITRDVLRDLDTRELSNGLSRISIRKAIIHHCRKKSYHQALLIQKHRYDLEGNPAQEIMDCDRAYAQAQLDLIEACHQKWQHRRDRSRPPHPAKIKPTSSGQDENILETNQHEASS